MHLNSYFYFPHVQYNIHCRWLKQEYELPFPLNRQPPVHMPIAYGLVDISKQGKRLQQEPTPSQAYRECDSPAMQSDNIESEGEIAGGIEDGRVRCFVCSKQDDQVH